jgi:two-component system, OmpR family, sensor histidine kinase ChvG
MAENTARASLPRLKWPLRATLTARILFVNIIALGLLAGSLFYIDSYRSDLLAERFRLAREEVQIAAACWYQGSVVGSISS